MSRGFKLHNDYAASLGRLYAETPKAVFAALAYSYASRIAESTEPGTIAAEMTAEWQTLFDNEIVPQKPPVYMERTKG